MGVMDNQTNTRPARLYRSRDDRVVAGIGGGLGRYLGIDPVLVRIAIVVLALMGGGGVLAYLIAWLVIPEEPAGETPTGAEPPPARTAGASLTARIVIGTVLVAIGLGMLLDWAIPSFNRVFLPLLVITGGLGLVYYGVRR